MTKPDIKSDILQAIGNTPLVKLNKVNRGVEGELLAKCEFMNPGGSIKDRIGAYIIEDAERAGLIKPGGTVVEATSGNTGMGLALAAAIKGYKSIFVMPEKMSEEKRQNLRAFGAKVVITPTGVAPESPQSHYSVAARLAKETPNSFYSNQYHNLKNRETHYKQTGPEIWAQTNGEFDAICIGMGTCGTISGLGKFFKEKKPSIKIVGIDPKGSILKDLFETGKAPSSHSYKVEGIGEDMVPNNLDFSVVDEIVRIEDKESLLMTRQLLTKEGIFCGTSSGAAVVGALRYMAQSSKPQRVIAILPDSGNRYLSKVFNDAWMVENSFLEKRPESRIVDMLKALNKTTSKIIFAAATDKVENVVRQMKDQGVSQLPVIKNGQVVGMIAEAAMLRPLFMGTIRPSDPIESLVENNYALVQESDAIDRLNEIFTSGKVALVFEANELRHILTKIDLISYLSLQSGV